MQKGRVLYTFAVVQWFYLRGGVGFGFLQGFGREFVREYPLRVGALRFNLGCELHCHPWSVGEDGGQEFRARGFLFLFFGVHSKRRRISRRSVAGGSEAVGGGVRLFVAERERDGVVLCFLGRGLAMAKELKLNNGLTMPSIGLGTISFNESDEKIKFAIVTAIRMGYRHIDTANGYHNEMLVGEAFREAFRLELCKREDLFVTTKLSPDEMAPEDIIPSLQNSLSKMKLDYVDCFMIHWPLQLKKGSKMPPREGDFLPLDLRSTWAAMELCVEKGLTKSIGVSNFNVAILKDLVSFAKILPVVNQVELHPRWQQKRLREYCESVGIIVEAWSPLGAPGQKYGTHDLLANLTLKGIAEKHQKTTAQVCLRWILECGCSSVPKSFNRLRMSQNFAIFDWKLDEEDHEMIASIPQNRYFLASFLCNKTTSPFRSVEDLWDGDV